MKPEEEPRKVPFNEATKMIGDGSEIHTLVQAHGTIILLGANWPRKDILEAFKKHGVHEVGENGQKLGHGLAFWDPDRVDGTGSWVFVETKTSD